MNGSLYWAGGMIASLNFHLLPQELANGLLYGSIYALIALGYTMVYGILQLINFAHSEVFMLGAYGALFTSWELGYLPGASNYHPGTVWDLVLMLVVAMIISAVVGILIERLAYRPLRSQPRLSTLITAIGMSLLLQYAGQLFLPNSPAPNINQAVNPFQREIKIPLKPRASDLVDAESKAEKITAQAKANFESEVAAEGNPAALKPAALSLQAKYFDAQNTSEEARVQADQSGIIVDLPEGQVIMFITTIVLMAILTYLILFTKQGRAMRAVSHDFDSASLMGINVDSIITFTFLIGSALAGAAAMMLATFQSGIAITTFFGMLPGVKAFVAAVLGGIGNIPGAVLGGLLMGVAESMVVWAGYPNWKDAVAFFILILVLLVRPTGLLGSSKVEKV